MSHPRRRGVALAGRRAPCHPPPGGARRPSCPCGPDPPPFCVPSADLARPSRRTAALRVAILTIERWRAGNRGLDDGVGHALERARADQWANYQRIALRRLASAVPWRATALRVGMD